MKHNEIYIELQDNRFYSPGEVIKGQVILDLAKATRTKFVHITFSGEVRAGGRSCSLFTQNYVLYNNEKGLLNTLEAQEHRFPFEISIPGTPYELPSTMQLSKIAQIQYQLVALQGKPFLPESLSPQFKMGVSILEHIPVDSYSLSHKAEAKKETSLAESADSRKVSVTLQTSVCGLVRGDVLSAELCVAHLHSFSRKKAVRFQLIRKTSLCASREVLEKRPILIHELDLCIPNSPDFSHTLEAKLRIPTTTPPSLGNSGRIISVEYYVQASVNLNDEKRNHASNEVVLEIPITIGTFPRQDIAIEDDVDGEETLEDNTSEETGQLEVEFVNEPMNNSSLLSTISYCSEKDDVETNEIQSASRTEHLNSEGLMALLDEEINRYPSQNIGQISSPVCSDFTRRDTISSSGTHDVDQTFYHTQPPFSPSNSSLYPAMSMPSPPSWSFHGTEPCLLAVPNAESQAPGTPQPIHYVKRSNSNISHVSNQHTIDDQDHRPAYEMPAPQRQYAMPPFPPPSPNSPFMIRPQMPSAYPNSQQYNMPQSRPENPAFSVTDMPSASSFVNTPWTGY